MVDIITIVVITIVVFIFLAAMYKGLKEPIDSLIVLIKKGLGKVADAGSSGGGVEVIKYE